jgi:hypothetical protein
MSPAPALHTHDPDRWLLPPAHVPTAWAPLYGILPRAGACRCPHFPRVPCLDYFIGRPRTDYSHWWRQRQLLFWPWNPPMDEEIARFKHRLMLVLFVLCFNLSVLTTWAALFQTFSDSVADQIASVPLLGQLFVLYVSASLLQAIFVGLTRPCLALALTKLPRMRRSADSRIRTLAMVLHYAAVTIAVFFLVLVVLGLVILLSQYRCDVFIDHVLMPFIYVTVMNLCWAYAVVPLPLLYHLQNAYGSMPTPIGGGHLDHERAEATRLGIRRATVDSVMVEYTHNDADEFYRRMNVNVWR